MAVRQKRSLAHLAADIKTRFKPRKSKFIVNIIIVIIYDSRPNPSEARMIHNLQSFHFEYCELEKDKDKDIEGNLVI